MESAMNMKKPYEHSTGEEIRDLIEAAFVAVEPFLKPLNKNSKIIYPTSPLSQIFFDVLIDRYNTLNELDPGI